MRRIEEWKVGRVEEWKVGRLEDWKIGRLKGWKSGRMEEWKTGRLNAQIRASRRSGELQWDADEHGFRGYFCFVFQFDLIAHIQDFDVDKPWLASGG
jgi:hypothetical protein